MLRALQSGLAAASLAGAVALGGVSEVSAKPVELQPAQLDVVTAGALSLTKSFSVTSGGTVATYTLTGSKISLSATLAASADPGSNTAISYAYGYAPGGTTTANTMGAVDANGASSAGVATASGGSVNQVRTGSGVVNNTPGGSGSSFTNVSGSSTSGPVGGVSVGGVQNSGNVSIALPANSTASAFALTNGASGYTMGTIVGAPMVGGSVATAAPGSTVSVSTH